MIKRFRQRCKAKMQRKWDLYVFFQADTYIFSFKLIFICFLSSFHLTIFNPVITLMKNLQVQKWKSEIHLHNALMGKGCFLLSLPHYCWSEDKSICPYWRWRMSLHDLGKKEKVLVDFWVPTTFSMCAQGSEWATSFPRTHAHWR